MEQYQKVKHICNWDVRKRRKRESGAEEILTQTISKLMKDTKPQIQVDRKTSTRINFKTSIPRYIMVKPQKTKDKEKILMKDRGGIKQINNNNNKLELNI